LVCLSLLACATPKPKGQNESFVNVTDPGMMAAVGVTVTMALDKATAVADDADAITVTITAVDKDNPSSPIAAVRADLSASGSGNTFAMARITTDATGTASTTLKSTKAEAKTITATLVDAASVSFQASATFGPGAADANKTTLAISKPDPIADGDDTVVATVNTFDAHDNIAPGAAVTMTVGGSGNTYGSGLSGTTDAMGIFTLAIASTVAEAKTIQAIVLGQTRSQVATFRESWFASNGTPVGSTAVFAERSGTLVTVTDAGAVFHTADDGATWATWDEGLPASVVLPRLTTAVVGGVPCFYLAPSFSVGNVYARCGADAAWMQLGTGITLASGEQVSLVAAQDGSSHNVYVVTGPSTSKVHQFTGGLWYDYSAGIAPFTNFTSFVVSTSGKLYAGDSSSVYAFPGASWSTIAGYTGGSVNALFIDDASSPAILYVGTAANAVLRYRTDSTLWPSNGLSWESMKAGLPTGTDTSTSCITPPCYTSATIHGFIPSADTLYAAAWAYSYSGGIPFNTTTVSGSGLYSVPLPTTGPTGPTWIFETNQPPSLDQLALDPSASGAGRFVLPAARGATWSARGGPGTWSGVAKYGLTGKNVTGLAVSATKAYAATNGNAFTTTDGGVVWQPLAPGPTGPIGGAGQFTHQIQTIHRVERTGRLFATTHGSYSTNFIVFMSYYYAGAMYSDDDGATWSGLNESASALSPVDSTLAVHDDGTTTFVAWLTPDGIYKLDGNAWTAPDAGTNPGLPGAVHVTLVASGGAAPDIYAATSTQVQKRNYAGTIWTPVGSAVGHTVHDIAVNPTGGDVWAATDAGLFVLKGGTTTWAQADPGAKLGANSYDSLFLDSAAGYLFVGGTRSTGYGAMYRLSLDGKTAERASAGLAGSISVIAKNGNTLYVADGTYGVMRSTTGGR
jgi:hypothetical protein